MENKNTTGYLNGTAWYRLLKVFYILSFIAVIIAIISQQCFGCISFSQYFDKFKKEYPAAGMSNYYSIEHGDLCEYNYIFTEGFHPEVYNSLHCDRLSDIKKNTITKQILFEDVPMLLLSIALAMLMFEITRRVFYYIVLGTIRPKK